MEDLKAKGDSTELRDEQLSKTPSLKMYVWEDVLIDYTSGMMCALASSPEEARKVLLEACSYIPEGDLAQEPQVITTPRGFACWGSG